MPCRCDYMEDSTEQEQKQEIHALTQHLCFMCGEAEEKNEMSTIRNVKLRKWWERHHADDTKRVTSKMKEFIRQNPDKFAEEVAMHFISEAMKKHSVSTWHRKWFINLAKELCPLS